MLDGFTIPNGGAWSPDDKLFYWADSATGNIFVFDFDGDAGTIANKRVFFHVDQEDCVPDGFCVDEEGHIWVAVHGMGKVLRVTPQGCVVAEISLPTRCVTCPCFVGEDLYITSMFEVAPEKYPDSVKYEGNLFRCHVGVRGMKPYEFKPQVVL